MFFLGVHLLYAETCAVINSGHERVAVSSAREAMQVVEATHVWRIPRSSEARPNPAHKSNYRREDTLQLLLVFLISGIGAELASGDWCVFDCWSTY